MKKWWFLTGGLVVLTLAGAFVWAQHEIPRYPKGKTLTVEEVRKRWGDQKFSRNAFRRGDMKTRASMAASLIASREFIGEDIRNVRKELGRPDGFYQMDWIPAYLIEDSNDMNVPAWQVVFAPGKKHTVSEVFAHEVDSDIREFRESGGLEKLRKFVDALEKSEKEKK